MTKAKEIIADAFYHVNCDPETAADATDDLIMMLANEGFVIVPLEPTEAMRGAAVNTPLPEQIGDFPFYEKIWRTMIVASQTEAA